MIDYDKFTAELARYPTEQTDPRIVEAMYVGLGLVGEAGEVSEKIKKWHRDGKVDPFAVALELGDVLYYLTRCANCFGYSLEDIKHFNVKKLSDRRDRGVLKGDGDDR
jgi:NTP pyrophosphatase (non-canonical NTP hydrolase)